MEDQDSARIKEIKKALSFPLGEPLHLSSASFDSKINKYPSSQYEKKIFSQIKNNSPKGLKHKTSLTLELKQMISQTHTIQELAEKLLQLSPFRQFEACHILIHEKGKPVGQNYSYDHAVFGNSKNITIQSFNSLFNLIKKSKNKIFTQSLTLKDDLDVVGNFLGKEIDLKNYSVICLISRNSFLSPSTEEQDNFNLMTSLLPPLLNKILGSEKSNRTLDLLIKSLRMFPEKLTIKDSLRVIFTNDLVGTPNTSTTTTFALDNTNLLSMELATTSKDQVTAEIFHSQRVALLGELLNTLQHELSNPLFGLSLTAQLLQSDTNSPDSNTILKEIGQNAKRSQVIIKNFSHLYSDLPDSKVINLYQLVEEVITLTKSETREIKKEIEAIGFSRDQDLPVLTNPTYLGQIIFNLIINAAQAIKTSKESLAKNKIIIQMIKHEKHVEIHIRDDGPGVPPQLLNNIFSPFFTTKVTGTGLGLSICQNLAKKLHSQITFKNNSPFPGATFSIDLPLE